MYMLLLCAEININNITVYVLFVRKEKKTIEELQRESEEKKWRNLPPRERMRIQKQRKADEEAKKLA